MPGSELNGGVGPTADLPPFTLRVPMPDLPAVQGITARASEQLSSITSRFGIGVADIARYVGLSERLLDFGNGGSESLVMFIEQPGVGRFVRKICSEAFSSVTWDTSGDGVMSPPSTKANLQVQYLEGLPDAVRPYFPEVHRSHHREVRRPDGQTAHELVYDLSVLEGVEVSSFVAEHQPTPRIVAHLHREVLRCLAERVHPHREVENAGDTIGPSYLSKIVDRLAMCEAAAPDIFTPLTHSDRIIVNGRPYRNIGELIEFFARPEISRLLEPKYHSLVMGDTNTENVMITKPEALLAAMEADRIDFTYDDIGLRFLDPRAIGHASSGAKTVDDRMYDNKPLHNSLGNYDIIHGEHFDLALDRRGNTPRVAMRAHPGNPYEQPYKDMEQYFGYIMDGWDVNGEEFARDDPNWVLRFAFMMGTHFAAMPPFHFTKEADGSIAQDPQAQKRAIALYCEGIKWLNTAYDMLTNRRWRLHYVPVPDPEVHTAPDIRVYRTDAASEVAPAEETDRVAA